MEPSIDEGRLWDGAVLPLLRFCESIYTDNRALRQVLTQLASRDWKDAWSQARLTAASDGEVRKEFAALYGSLGDKRKFHEAIQEFLRIKRAV